MSAVRTPAGADAAPLHATARPPRSGRGPVAPWVMALGASLWMALVGNLVLWQRLAELDLLHGLRGWAFGAGLVVMVGACLGALANLLAWRPVFKPALTVLLCITAVAAHFMRTYNVLIDPGMVVNVLQTDPREAEALLSLSMVVNLALVGLLPAWLVWRVRVDYGPLRSRLWRNPLRAMAAMVVATLAVWAIFQPLSAAMRNHKDLRYLLNPLASLYAVGKVAARPFERDTSTLLPIGQDAHLVARTATPGRAPLLLLVVGETARSQNFGINGYARATTPALEREGVASFTDAWSCGTSTAASLPCMFSHLPRTAFEGRKANYENLLDVLQRAGLAVLWLDNQAGCKGVCDRVPHAQAGEAVHGGAGTSGAPAASCKDGECFDTAMLEGLDQRLATLDPVRRARGTVVVLHQMGSHGPAYSARSPAAFKRFMPECQRTTLQDCSTQELVNAYDNSIAFTDHFLGQAIAWLRSQQEHADTAMVYVSDHGESLGEGNLYLHGMPYAIAPDAQKHVPWITWLSDGFTESSGITTECLRSNAAQPVSHDNYFHSVLGLMQVATQDYQRQLDAYAPCRPAAKT